MHGLKELANGSKFQKTIWAVVIIICTVFLTFQTNQLAGSYASESTVVQIGYLDQGYPPPLVMVAIPTRLLLRSQRQSKNASLPELDPEALDYARRAINARTVYSEDNLEVDPSCRVHLPLRISRRLVWYPYTYHVIEPDVELVNMSYLEQADGMRRSYDICLNWSRSPLGDYKQISLISYDIVNDNFILKPGDKYKLVFEISGSIALNLQRRPCVQCEFFHYWGRNDAACKEKCILEDATIRYPNACVTLPDVRHSLCQLYPRGRPCWKDVADQGELTGNGTGTGQYVKSLSIDGLWQELPNITKEYLHNKTVECMATTCFKQCKHLIVKYQMNMGTVAADEPADRSVLVMQWPTPAEVTVFEEKYLYSAETFVGEWGGLAGIWLGASVLSLIEMIYHCLCCCAGFANGAKQKTKL